MKEEADSFLNYLAKEKKFSQNTIDAYRNDLSQLATFVATQGNRLGFDAAWSSLSSQLLSDYVYKLREKEYRSSTLARKIAAIRSFVGFMIKAGKLPAGLSEGLKSPKVGRISPKSLSVSEVRRLLAETTKLPSPEAKRDRAMLELLYATGLRASELMSLNTSDIDLERGIVCCRGRGSAAREVAIDEPVLRIIKDYMDTVRPGLIRGEETALFVNLRGERLTRQGFWQIVKEYGTKTGLGHKVTPNVLRHSFAVHRIKSGADLSSVQKMLGHAYVSTTSVYKKIK